MAPVFSLVLDEDVSADIALTYPELYKDLMKVPVICVIIKSYKYMCKLIVSSWQPETHCCVCCVVV